MFCSIFSYLLIFKKNIQKYFFWKWMCTWSVHVQFHVLWGFLSTNAWYCKSENNILSYWLVCWKTIVHMCELWISKYQEEVSMIDWEWTYAKRPRALYKRYRQKTPHIMSHLGIDWFVMSQIMSLVHNPLQSPSWNILQWCVVSY